MLLAQALFGGPSTSARALHPLRGVRVGEASQPGPSSSSSSWAPPLPGTPAVITPATPQPASLQPPDSFRELFDQFASPASQQTPASAAPGSEQRGELSKRTFSLPMVQTGKDATLSCKWMPRQSSWRWEVCCAGKRLVHQSTHSPHTALRGWLAQHSDSIFQAGITRLEQALTEFPEPPKRHPPTPVAPRPSASLGPTHTVPPTVSQHTAATHLDPASIEFHLPSLTTLLADMGPFDLTLLLQAQIVTQRSIPPSVLILVQQTMAHLGHIALDPAHPPRVREVAWVAWLLAPRWLWPEPSRAPGTPLHPHARPRLIRERARWLQEGNWHAILSALGPPEQLASAPSPAAESVHGPAPSAPGTFTTTTARAFTHMARQGRLTSAWRRLWSYGLAPPSASTTAALKAKWHPELERPVWAPPPACTATASALHTDARLKRSLRELAHGTAADAHGWTAEAAQQLLRHPPVLQHARELLILYTTGDGGDVLVDLCNTSLLVPLNKNLESTDVRPIAIPGLWRKLASRNCVSAYKADLRQGAGPHQHSAMLPNGSTLMALKAQALVASQGSTLAVVRTDIANAFNDVSRTSALQALHDVDPQLAACQHTWLTRPTVAVTRATGGLRDTLRTCRGIPQGDPLSSLTFTAVLAKPLAAMTELPECSVTPLAFADDTLLVCPRDQIVPVVHQWERLLQGHSLRAQSP